MWRIYRSHTKMKMCVSFINRAAERVVKMRHKPEDGYILPDKNKFGHAGLVDLIFHGAHQRFREPDKTSAIAPRIERSALSV